MPTMAPGIAAMMISGSIHDWKSTTIRQYTRITATPKPRPRLENAWFMTSPWPRIVICIPAGKAPREATCR